MKTKFCYGRENPKVAHKDSVPSAILSYIIPSLSVGKTCEYDRMSLLWLCYIM